MMGTEKQDIDFLWKVHDYLSDMSKYADAKLGFCMLFGTGFVGFLMSIEVLDQLFNQALNGGFGLLDMSGAAAMTLLVLAIVLALVGFSPRTTWNRSGQSGTKGLIFWDAILAHGDAKQYGEYYVSAMENARRDHLVEQIFTLAGVVQTKFLLIKWALWLLLVGNGAGVLYIIGHTTSSCP